jgi:tripartite-type tricarboxylate transporter receptor subunit TctC
MRGWTRPIASIALMAAVSPARADAVADFYHAHPVYLVHSGGEGGGYATYAQVFAAFFPRHMPGNPQIVTQMMPGAGGVREMQHFTSVAPRDGTMIGFVQSGVSFAPLLGQTNATFDAAKLNWLGAMSRVNAVCAAWKGSGVETWRDLVTKPYIVGSSGAGSLTETQPALLNHLFGARIKVVSGYNGANEIYLAMERGELQGRCGSGVPSLELARPGWVSGHKVEIPVQFGFERGSTLPDTPTVYEMARDDRQRAILDLALAPVEMNRPMMTTPGVPAERLAALRAAFHATLNDPDFRAEAARQKLEIEENSAERVTKTIQSAYALPPDIVADARAAMKPGGAP